MLVTRCKVLHSTIHPGIRTVSIVFMFLNGFIVGSNLGIIWNHLRSKLGIICCLIWNHLRSNLGIICFPIWHHLRSSLGSYCVQLGDHLLFNLESKLGIICFPIWDHLLSNLGIIYGPIWGSTVELYKTIARRSFQGYCIGQFLVQRIKFSTLTPGIRDRRKTTGNCVMRETIDSCDTLHIMAGKGHCLQAKE